MKKLWMGFVLLAVAGSFLGLRAEEMKEAGTMDSTLSTEVKIGTDIDAREPVGVGTSFPVDTPSLVGWSRVAGANEAIEITHVWKQNGDVVAKVPLKVTSSPFRTYSRKTLHGNPAGNWVLEVVGPGDAVIGSQSFVVGAPEK